MTVEMYDCRNVYIRLFTFPCEPEGSLLGSTDVPYLRLRRRSFGTRRGDGGSRIETLSRLDGLMVIRTLKMPLQNL